MSSRRFIRGFSFIAVGLLLCACGAVFHPNLQRDPTELRVEEVNELHGQVREWNEESWVNIKPSNDLRWMDCYPGGFQCARLLVPLDYNNPGKDTAAIALVRLPASVPTNSSEYLGPILFNPGGPGGSGVDLVRALGANFTSVLGDQFDIVGFDPRGVSRSTPRVSFYESRVERKLWATAGVGELNHSAITVGSSWARNKITGQLAVERDRNVLAHINTDHTARDMLRITEAHGREKLQYWGFSYGTVLGSTFAAMFPDKVHRLVIDGVVDVSDDYYTTKWTTNLRDTDNVLQWFFKDCLKAGLENCAFYEPSIEAMNTKLNDLYSAIIHSPVSVKTNSSYGIVDYARVRSTIFRAFYKPFAIWPMLATGLQDLVDGNGTALYNILDNSRFRCSCDPLEHAFDSVEDATTAIACNDGDPIPSGLEDAFEHYREVLRVSEWGSVWAGIRMTCGGWSPDIPKTQFRGPIVGNTSFPLLLIGNTADPVTPLWAAHKVSKGFPGSVVLSQDSAGHCSLSAPSICTARAVREYFVNGTLPKDGTICPVVGTPFVPSPEKRLGGADSPVVDSGSQNQAPLGLDTEEQDRGLLKALEGLTRFRLGGEHGFGTTPPLHV
ncbi:hypothetical protein E1B28_008285 [Marasmius oreades]|uniref:Alpha/beta-hydrolase n=1 Tax=Marasmius oreades TaxID=181124 RepID=A0A9P7RY02_9AGAR|nr:uncharacterized protein E1B28_008285 [Marasmius oreades]KAG7091884.1 hypothetical protein E1B28_008285 [Marasmius oreades]